MCLCGCVYGFMYKFQHCSKSVCEWFYEKFLESTTASVCVCVFIFLFTDFNIAISDLELQ